MVKRKTLGFYLALAGAALLVLFMLLPLIFMVCGSFMGAQEIERHYGILRDGGVSGGIYETPQYASLHFLPEQFTLEQYYRTALTTSAFWDNFWNTVLLTLPGLAGALVTSTLFGYGFAKFRFPGRRVFLFLYLIVMMLPYQVTLVPTFMVLDALDLIGSRAAVILPNCFTTFGCYLMYQYTDKVPDDILEYARIEGLGEIGVFFRIFLPQMKTGAASLCVLNLIDGFSMLEQPLIFLQDAAKQPLSVSLSYINQADITIAFVSGVLFVFPLLLVFLLGKDPLARGISESVI